MGFRLSCSATDRLWLVAESSGTRALSGHTGNAGTLMRLQHWFGILQEPQDQAALFFGFPELV
ncbi:MAG: hypothetical protein WBQ69_06825, partial [Gallionella sp.]